MRLRLHEICPNFNLGRTIDLLSFVCFGKICPNSKQQVVRTCFGNYFDEIHCACDADQQQDNRRFFACYNIVVGQVLHLKPCIGTHVLRQIEY